MPQWQSCYGSCDSINCSSYGRLQAPKVLRQRKLPQQYESLCSKRFCGFNHCCCFFFFFPLSGFSPSGHRSSCSHGESRTQRNKYSPRSLGGGLKKRVPENQKTSRKSQKGRSLGKQTVKLFKNLQAHHQVTTCVDPVPNGKPKTLRLDQDKSHSHVPDWQVRTQT